MSGAKNSKRIQTYDLIFILIGMLVTISFIFFHISLAPISNSIKSPWGIITSNFVYDGYGNLEAYILYTFLFLATSSAYGYKTRKKRYLTIIYSMFIGGVMANILWLYTMYTRNSTITSAGESSVIYAFIGAYFAIVLIDAIIIVFGLPYTKLFKKKPYLHYLKSPRRKWRWVGGGFFNWPIHYTSSRLIRWTSCFFL
jgi:uncharacterized BrkB/YihY/UPF0761 family membrane protein